MDRVPFIERINIIKEAILRVGGKFYSFDVGSTVQKELFEELKVVYGIDFPADFIDIATTVAGSVNITWSLYNDKGRAINKNLSFIKKGNNISSGEMCWDATKYLKEEILKIYHNPANDYELVGKLHIFDVPNGDMVMFDMTKETLEKPIIYLSHDEISRKAPQLAPSFTNYISNLLAIGLVGSDIEQTEYFINEESGGLDATLPASQEWRKAIGIEGMPLCF